MGGSILRKRKLAAKLEIQILGQGKIRDVGKQARSLLSADSGTTYFYETISHVIFSQKCGLFCWMHHPKQCCKISLISSSHSRNKNVTFTSHFPKQRHNRFTKRTDDGSILQLTSILPPRRLLQRNFGASNVLSTRSTS